MLIENAPPSVVSDGSDRVARELAPAKLNAPLMLVTLGIDNVVSNGMAPVLMVKPPVMVVKDGKEIVSIAYKLVGTKLFMVINDGQLRVVNDTSDVRVNAPVSVVNKGRESVSKTEQLATVRPAAVVKAGSVKLRSR